MTQEAAVEAVLAVVGVGVAAVVLVVEAVEAPARVGVEGAVVRMVEGITIVLLVSMRFVLLVGGHLLLALVVIVRIEKVLVHDKRGVTLLVLLVDECMLN